MRDRLRQTIKEVQAWHAIPGDIGHVAYDFAGLQVEGLQQPCWKAPWTASGQFVSARDCEMQHLQQLKTRRDEELQILCREAEHMVEFYQKQKSDLHAALLAKQSGLHERALSACPEHLKPSFSPAQQDRLSQQFTQGQQYILIGKLV